MGTAIMIARSIELPLPTLATGSKQVQLGVGVGIPSRSVDTVPR